MDSITQRYGIMQDLMVKAFECDMTRIFDFMIGHECMNVGFTGVPSATWHDYSHKGDASATYSELNQVLAYNFQKYVELVQKLKAVKDAAGVPLLDNTLLVFHTGFGDGTNHQPVNMHFFLAGKGAGKFRPGLAPQRVNGDVGDLWLTIARAHGSTRTSFGNGKNVISNILA